MMWTHSEYDGGTDEVLDKMNSLLKGLQKQAAIYAKIAATDVRNAEARTVVFWNLDVPSTPSPFPSGTDWKYETYTTTNPTDCWYECIYKQIEKKLNSLTTQQSCHAKICFTDAEAIPASISIYWLA